MRKIIFLFILFFTFTGHIFASCEIEQSMYNHLKEQFDNIEKDVRKSYSWPESLVNALVLQKQEDTYKELTKVANSLKSCLQNEIDTQDNLYKEGKNAYNKWDYLTAIEKFEQLFKIYPNDEDIKNALYISYWNQMFAEEFKNRYESANNYAKNMLKVFPKDYVAHLHLWMNYFSLEDFNNAEKYFNLAYEYASKQDDIKQAQNFIDKLNEYKTKKEQVKELEIKQKEDEKQVEINKKLEQQKQNELKKQQEKEEKLKQKAQIAFNQIEKILSQYSEKKQKQTYEWILKTLNWYKTKITSWDKKIILDHLIYLVNIELWNEDIDLNDLFWDLFNK